MRPPSTRPRGFTLLELLVVIGIIAILVGLLFPAFKGVQNQAKSTQAKNDLTQIVNAVNAFYTDYGKYPVPSTAPGGSDIVYTATLGTLPSFGNDWLFNELRACPTSGTLPATCSRASTNNTRQIVYLSPPLVKDPNSPKSGIGTTGINTGRWFDPWGSPYNVEFDGSYDNQVSNPYGGSGGAGVDPLPQGVIGWSLGADLQLGISGVYTNSDDVISWQ